jgi:uncharacterized protein YndB with AHSA1/START domain
VSQPSTYTVERSTVVRAPAERVYEEVVDFHRWPAWSPWEELDPRMRRNYKGPAQGPGSVYEWSGNRKAGAGRMEVVEVVPGSRVAVDLRFLKPFKSRSTTTFAFVPEGEQTRVTWTMTGDRTLGLKVMGIFTSMDKLVGGDFERGLSRLKSVAEGPHA